MRKPIGIVLLNLIEEATPSDLYLLGEILTKASGLENPSDLKQAWDKRCGTELHIFSPLSRKVSNSLQALAEEMPSALSTEVDARQLPLIPRTEIEQILVG